MDGIIEPLNAAWTACERAADLRSGQAGATLLSIIEARMNLRPMTVGESPHCVVHRIEQKHLPIIKTNQDIVLAVVRPGDASAQHLAEAYRDFKQHLPSTTVAMVFVIVGAEGFRELARTSLTPIVVLSKDVALTLVSGDVRPQKILHQQLCQQVSIADLNPYEAAGPVKPAMFYGRQEELKRLLSPLNKGLGVIGQRGIGKSSLLLAAHRWAVEEGTYTSLYVDAEVFKTPEALGEELYRRLLPNEHEEHRPFKLDGVLARASGQKMILLLLDEMDTVTRECERLDDWSLFVHLQTGAVRGNCRCVMAGYREFRRGILAKGHRLFNFFDRIELGPLSPVDARQLIVEPFTDVGVGFTDLDATVRQITDWSSGHPAYIQLFCTRLLEHLHKKGSPAREITRADLVAVEQDPSLHNYIVNTFVHDTPALEKCVVYAVLDRASFDEKDVADSLLRIGLRPGMNRILQACDDLAMANVFTREVRGYRFLFGGFCKAIREHLPSERVLQGFVDEVRSAGVTA